MLLTVTRHTGTDAVTSLGDDSQEVLIVKVKQEKLDVKPCLDAENKEGILRVESEEPATLSSGSEDPPATDQVLEGEPVPASRDEDNADAEFYKSIVDALYETPFDATRIECPVCPPSGHKFPGRNQLVRHVLGKGNGKGKWKGGCKYMPPPPPEAGKWISEANRRSIKRRREQLIAAGHGDVIKRVRGDEESEVMRMQRTEHELRMQVMQQELQAASAKRDYWRQRVLLLSSPSSSCLDGDSS